MKKIILNQKSYLLYDEILMFKNDFNKLNKSHFDFILFPQIIYLSMFDSKNYYLGAQNFYSSKVGSFTGEVNLESLNSIGVSYIMLNQYERLKLMNEDKRIVKEKLYKALNNKFNVILYIGENKRTNKPMFSIKNEINYFLNSIDKKLLKYVSIVYEPKYFVSKTDINYMNYISKNIKRIKNYIKSKYSINMDIYYSGFIDMENVNEIIDDCDGIVINKNSTDINEIKKIINEIE